MSTYGGPSGAGPSRAPGSRSNNLYEVNNNGQKVNGSEQPLKRKRTTSFSGATFRRSNSKKATVNQSKIPRSKKYSYFGNKKKKAVPGSSQQIAISRRIDRLKRMQARKRFVERARKSFENELGKTDPSVVVVSRTGNATVVGPKPDEYGALPREPHRPRPTQPTLFGRLRSFAGFKSRPYSKKQKRSSARSNSQSRAKRRYSEKVVELQEKLSGIVQELTRNNISNNKKKNLREHRKLLDERIIQLSANYNKKPNKILNNYGLERLSLLQKARVILAKIFRHQFEPISERELVIQIREMVNLLATTSDQAKQRAIKEAIRQNRLLLRRLRSLAPVARLTSA